MENQNPNSENAKVNKDKEFLWKLWERHGEYSFTPKVASEIEGYHNFMLPNLKKKGYLRDRDVPGYGAVYFITEAGRNLAFAENETN